VTNLDYVALVSIPPLPLYALLAADEGFLSSSSSADPDAPGDQTQGGDIYSALFEQTNENVDNIMAEDVFPGQRKSVVSWSSDVREPASRKPSVVTLTNLTGFGPKQVSVAYLPFSKIV